MIDRKRRVRMAFVDELPDDWREMVHEYGLSIVMALRQCGVIKSAHGRHIIETVMNELSPTRGGFSNQGVKKPSESRLYLIPIEPTPAMIAASMATVADFELKITKREKHRRRLSAALHAAIGSKK